MTMLREGDEVTILCQICAKPINPTANFRARVCSRECHEELEWREALTIQQGNIGNFRGFARYKFKGHKPASEVTER